MKRIISSILTTTLLVVIALLVVSKVSAVSFKELVYEPDRLLRPNSKRMKNVAYSLPLFDTVRYNWLALQLEDKEPEGFLVVDEEMYFPLSLETGDGSKIPKNTQTSTVSYSSFDLTHAGVMRSDRTIDKPKLEELRKYYLSRRLLMSDVKGLTVLSGNFRESLKTNYTTDSIELRTVIQNQIEAARLVLRGNQLRFRDLVLELGYSEIDTTQPEFTWQFQKNAILQQVARNIWTAFRDWSVAHETEKELPVRILLQNSVAYVAPGENKKPVNAAAAVAGDANSQSKNARFTVGLNYQDLLYIRQQIIFFNQVNFPKVPNIQNRIGLSLDVGKLVKAWDEFPAEFDDTIQFNQKKPVTNLDELGKKIKKDLAPKNFLGQVQDRFIKQVVLSYTPTRDERQNRAWMDLYRQKREINEKEEIDEVATYLPKEFEGLYLPYTRATKKRYLTEQLKLAALAVRISDIGRRRRGVVHFSFPRRENFPFLHALVRPVVESGDIARMFVYKNDGATTEEQQKSLEWVNHYLYSKVP